MVGPVAGYEEMTLPELARYGLEKMGVAAPDADEDPCVVALENFLHGRAGRAMGASAGGMDSAARSFVDAKFLGVDHVDRYLQGRANGSMDGARDARGHIAAKFLDDYINST
jgi:hypothetical protein